MDNLTYTRTCFFTSGCRIPFHFLAIGSGSCVPFDWNCKRDWLLISDFKHGSMLLIVLQGVPNRVNVGSVADVSKAHPAYDFRIEVGRADECLYKLFYGLTDPLSQGWAWGAWRSVSPCGFVRPKHPKAHPTYSLRPLRWRYPVHSKRWQHCLDLHGADSSCFYKPQNCFVTL
jgi:hypothetical protein